MKSDIQAVIEEQRARYESEGAPLLARLAKVHGLSVRQMATIFKVSNGYAHDLMQHKALPTLELAFKLARYFEVTVDELFGWRVDDTGDRRPLLVEIPGEKEPLRLIGHKREHDALPLVEMVAKQMKRERG